MAEVIAFLTGNLDKIGIAIGAVVAALVAIAAITPTKKDDEIIGKIQAILIKLGVVKEK